jgi:hypothetical protein
MLAIILMQLIYICKHRNIEHFGNRGKQRSSINRRNNTPQHINNDSYNIDHTEQHTNNSAETIDINTITDINSNDLTKNIVILEEQQDRLINTAALINKRKHADEIIANIKHVQEEMYKL